MLAVPGTQAGCFARLGGIGQPSPRALGFFSQRSVQPPLTGPHPRPKVRVEARTRPGLHHSPRHWPLGLLTTWESARPQPSLDRSALGLPAAAAAEGALAPSEPALGEAWPPVTGLRGRRSWGPGCESCKWLSRHTVGKCLGRVGQQSEMPKKGSRSGTRGSGHLSQALSSPSLSPPNFPSGAFHPCLSRDKIPEIFHCLLQTQFAGK